MVIVFVVSRVWIFHESTFKLIRVITNENKHIVAKSDNKVIGITLKWTFSWFKLNFLSLHLFIALFYEIKRWIWFWNSTKTQNYISVVKHQKQQQQNSEEKHFPSMWWWRWVENEKKNNIQHFSADMRPFDVTKMVVLCMALIHTVFASSSFLSWLMNLMNTHFFLMWNLSPETALSIIIECTFSLFFFSRH